jgi:hypothetical protein
MCESVEEIETLPPRSIIHKPESRVNRHPIDFDAPVSVAMQASAGAFRFPKCGTKSKGKTGNSHAGIMDTALAFPGPIEWDEAAGCSAGVTQQLQDGAPLRRRHRRDRKQVAFLQHVHFREGLVPEQVGQRPSAVRNVPRKNSSWPFQSSSPYAPVQESSKAGAPGRRDRR